MGDVGLRNPFVLRVGQVMSGFGAGCGLGIGVGVPIPSLDIPGISGVMSAAQGATRRIGGSHHVQSLIRRVGIKNLQAGIGCGVGIGHGFGVGIALKPGVAQQAVHLFQEAVSVLKNKLLSRVDGGGNQVEALPGIRTGSAQPGTVVSPNSEQGRIVPSIKHSDSEVVISDLAFVLLLMLASWLDRALCGTFSGLDSYSSEAVVGCLGLSYAILIQVERLQTQNEILRTLLRHQEKIEELEQQNALLREELNSERNIGNRAIQDHYARLPNLHQPSDRAICFSCRRRARRRT
ncbi:unnamed protein product [Sphagnum compactum]